MKKAKLAEGYFIEFERLFTIPADWQDHAGVGDYVCSLRDAKDRRLDRVKLGFGSGMSREEEAWWFGRSYLLNEAKIAEDKIIALVDLEWTSY